MATDNTNNNEKSKPVMFNGEIKHSKTKNSGPAASGGTSSISKMIKAASGNTSTGKKERELINGKDKERKAASRKMCRRPFGWQRKRSVC